MASTATSQVRRLSAADINRCDLYNGLITIGPAETLKKPSNGSETAAELERAKQSLDETASDAGTPKAEPQRPDPTITDKFAIAFDIDGVLVKGGKPIPASLDAMKYINGDNPYGVKM